MAVRRPSWGRTGAPSAAPAHAPSRRGPAAACPPGSGRAGAAARSGPAPWSRPRGRWSAPLTDASHPLPDGYRRPRAGAVGDADLVASVVDQATGDRLVGEHVECLPGAGAPGPAVRARPGASSSVGAKTIDADRHGRRWRPAVPIRIECGGRPYAPPRGWAGRAREPSSAAVGMRYPLPVRVVGRTTSSWRARPPGASELTRRRVEPPRPTTSPPGGRTMALPTIPFGTGGPGITRVG